MVHATNLPALPPGRAMPPHPPDTIMRAVNHFLKKSAPDASIASVVQVHPHKFHARFSATGRTYHYRMHVSPTPPSIFEQGRVWHVAAGNGTGVLGMGGAGYRGAGSGGGGAGVGDGDGDNGGGAGAGAGAGDGDGDNGDGAGGDGAGGLDIDAMRDAASRLLGTHDFSSFRANGCQATSPVRAVQVEVSSHPYSF
jgi:tRNA pseudouridine38-40 synthase